MSSDDETPHRLVGRAGLVFPYACFLISITMIGGAIYLLPLLPRVKIFLILATCVLVSLFVFMAIITHIAISRRWSQSSPAGKPEGNCKPGQNRSKRRPQQFT